ncbi:hypothetical protein N8K70_00920 [Microbacterium betulae]|uniref:Uncharacterized protein n=1 Tax=Microbacterium betulae TaxID=2981139 RepID=A0AA97I5Z6_9MICO|nr:hypothetical protein [Microbacterium sp. AB]WOF23264.1 hypothetical protein N8K70_00920 [Microbacterium sp. AB]
MGFSPLGLVVSIAALAPNLLLIWFPPRDQTPAAHAPRPLEWLERAGQALCLVLPAITRPGNIVWWWTLPAAIALVAYYALWTRYLIDGRLHTLLYEPLWRVPVPMAILPVGVFLATAAWLSNPWIAAAALVLGAGHVPVAIITSRTIASTP